MHSVRQMSGVIARLKVELHETLGGRLNNTTWKTNSSEISLAREIITETYVNGVDNNNDYKNDHNNDPVEINGGTLIQEQLINNNRRKKKMKNHKNEIKEEDKEMIIKDVNNKHALKPKSQNKALTKEKILAQHQESILKQEGITVLEILNKKVSIIDEILIKKIDDNEIKEVASLDDVITVLCKIQTLKEYLKGGLNNFNDNHWLHLFFISYLQKCMINEFAAKLAVSSGVDISLASLQLQLKVSLSNWLFIAMVYSKKCTIQHLLL